MSVKATTYKNSCHVSSSARVGCGDNAKWQEVDWLADGIPECDKECQQGTSTDEVLVASGDNNRRNTEYTLLVCCIRQILAPSTKARNRPKVEKSLALILAATACIRCDSLQHVRKISYLK